MNTTPSLGQLLHGFFTDYLNCQKGMRPSSIRGYRDAMVLFLRYAADHTGKTIAGLSLDDLRCEQVTDFLDWLESKRRNHIRTRNQRLTVVRAFFEYAASRAPECMHEAHRIATIARKRANPPGMRYMDADEVKALFDSLPTTGRLALRDHCLVQFLYNTGARAQEVCDLRVSHLELGPMPRVHLHGKGDKWRTCPLWTQTARMLEKLLASGGEALPGNPVFQSARKQALTRFGIHKIVRRLTRALDKPSKGPPMRPVSPHCFRHTTAVHLLESGVDPNVIRAWLGHVGLETTNRYAEVTLRMKQAALAKCRPPVGRVKATWRKNTDLLAWLKAL